MPLPIVEELARRVGVDHDLLDRKSLEFCRVEAGLIRRKREIRGMKPRTRVP